MEFARPLWRAALAPWDGASDAPGSEGVADQHALRGSDIVEFYKLPADDLGYLDDGFDDEPWFVVADTYYAQLVEHLAHAQEYTATGWGATPIGPPPSVGAPTQRVAADVVRQYIAAHTSPYLIWEVAGRHRDALPSGAAYPGGVEFGEHPIAALNGDSVDAPTSALAWFRYTDAAADSQRHRKCVAYTHMAPRDGGTSVDGPFYGGTQDDSDAFMREGGDVADGDDVAGASDAARKDRERLDAAMGDGKADGPNHATAPHDRVVVGRLCRDVGDESGSVVKFDALRDAAAKACRAGGAPLHARIVLAWDRQLQRRWVEGKQLSPSDEQPTDDEFIQAHLHTHCDYFLCGEAEELNAQRLRTHAVHECTATRTDGTGPLTICYADVSVRIGVATEADRASWGYRPWLREGERWGTASTVETWLGARVLDFGPWLDRAARPSTDDGLQDGARFWVVSPLDGKEGAAEKSNSGQLYEEGVWDFDKQAILVGGDVRVPVDQWDEYRVYHRS